MESGAGFAGPLLAGVLIATLGPTLVLWGNAASFLLSATLVIGCVPSLRGGGRTADTASYRDTLARGFRFVLRDPPIRGIFVIGAPLSFLIAPLFAVILPFYLQTSSNNALGLGGTVGAFGGGAVLGALVYGAVGYHWPRRITFLVGVFAIGGSFAVVAALPPVPIMIAALFLSGLISGPNGPLITTIGSSALSLHQGCKWGAQCEKWGHLRALSLVHCPDAVPSGEAGGRCSESAEEPTILQERTPPGLRGSVFGATTAIGYVSGPLGVLLAGGLLQTVGTRPTLLGATAVFFAVALALTWDRGLHELERHDTAPA